MLTNSERGGFLENGKFEDVGEYRRRTSRLLKCETYSTCSQSEPRESSGVNCYTFKSLSVFVKYDRLLVGLILCSG
jgi:hypothetical protein